MLLKQEKQNKAGLHHVACLKHHVGLWIGTLVYRQLLIHTLRFL